MEKYNPQNHYRRSIQLKIYDYSQPGAYFITICTNNHQCTFGEVVNGKMILNGYGKIAQQCWLGIPKHFPNVELDKFVIMPNHIHGIIVIHSDVGAPLAGVQNNEAGASPAPTVGNIIGAYKSIVVNRCLKIFKENGLYMRKIWQRNYYEHIIRNEYELNKIREYIVNNPLKWELDIENPEKKKEYKDTKKLRAIHELPLQLTIKKALLYRAGFLEDNNGLPPSFDSSLRMDKSIWEYKNTRFANFPEKRIIGITDLLTKSIDEGLVDFFNEKIKGVAGKDPKVALRDTMSFNGIGIQRKEAMFFNIIMPFMMAYSKDDAIIRFLRTMLETYPALSDNRLIRTFKEKTS